MKTFLKWAGNKSQIADRIVRELPIGSRLIEPFVGSGAIFAGSNYGRYFLADANPTLIGIYQQLIDEPDGLIAETRCRFVTGNDSGAYYSARNEFNRIVGAGGAATRGAAALFLYLNRHCYNGLSRFNRAGQFNVPFGRYKAPYFPEAELRWFAQKLQLRSASVACQDFRVTMSQAQFGDVVYCDPPYVPLSDTANFSSYSAGGFSMDDQRGLADLAYDLAKRGVPVVISNHDTPETRTMYEKANTIVSFPVRRSISCKDRGYAMELLAWFE